MKCWDDGLAQPAYKNNWFTLPNLPNDLHWAQSTALEQYKNNQEAYSAKGWPTYPMGGYNTTRVDNPIKDWVAGDEPCYEPIAGGKGWGNKICGSGQSSSSPTSSTASQAGSSSVASPEPAAPSASSSTSAPTAEDKVPTSKSEEKNDEQDDCEL